MRLIKPFVILALLTVSLSVAFALAPAEPGINVSVDPESLEIQGGGSGTITVIVGSQEGFEGPVDLKVLLKPAGVTESWSENPVEVPPFGEAETTLTITIAAGTPAGEAEIKVSGNAPEISMQQVPVIITIIESAGGEAPAASEEEAPAAGEIRTTTVTTTATTTVLATTTVSDITTVTETQVITTRDDIISVKTSATVEQAYDAIYPAVTILAVIVILAVAALSLRGR
ncbi:MAG: hypothetical protein QF535_20235 [Anaerolineales bacterium]|nr:hypothetical protein [Anaerolineales bacterium]